jgi:hypothetical protein
MKISFHHCRFVRGEGMSPTPSKGSCLREEERTSAVEMLRRLLPDDDLEAWRAVGSATVYSTFVTLWMLVLQRLGGGLSLENTVKQMIQHHGELFPDNQRVRMHTLSRRSGSYSQARKRLLLDVVTDFAHRVSQSLIELTPPWFSGQRAYLLDGTTITLAPTPELQKAFPPASNQHGETVWPIAQLLVAHELQSGCALLPEIGAMYGPDNTSETELASRLLQRLPPRSIVIGDSGFGIFRMAHATCLQGHDLFFRLTRARFKKLVRAATLVEQTDTTGRYTLRWKPSAEDRRGNPDLPGDAAVDVVLHRLPLDDQEELYLVTTLRLSTEMAGEWYRRRCDVESDIRDVKVTLETEKVRARSVDTVMKELTTSMVAYNLVVQFRRQAAEIAKVPPRRLSFTSVWTTFQTCLLRQPPSSLDVWEDRFHRALNLAAKDKLPNRPGRSYPRLAHPRRPKATKYQQQLARTKSKLPKDTEPPEPK